ncbi:hypothetical protein EHQ47_18445 [Leptospira bourretii]|uniref:hypothetical protein n=1 Tax=Leptospira bourretii TaxID=2484962 RepID=UPI001090C869|nr:hypothetical protein [Leptospira bourretii]TGL18016.1 hypothetical protein EHQ47_18445 [Leptospira bourretii]
MTTKQALALSKPVLYGLILIVISMSEILANDGLLDGVPYIDSSTSTDSQSPYLICLSEHLFQIEAGKWEDSKSKSKKEGNLIYYKKQGKLLEIYKEEKKIRINQNDQMRFKINQISSNQFEDVYLGIKDENEATEPSYLLYHYKPKNVIVLNYFGGGSAFGFNFMSATTANFMCKPMIISK